MTLRRQEDHSVEDNNLTKWKTMSRWMMDLDIIHTVEGDPGTTSTLEDKGTANRNNRKAIARVENRNATYNKEMTGGNNLRTSDIF